MNEKQEPTAENDESDTSGQRRTPVSDLEAPRDSDLLLALSQTLANSELLLALYRTLIEHTDLGSGLRSALEIVCKFADWDAGTAWLPTEDRQQIRMFIAWQSGAPALAEFIRSCANQSFAPNVGIVGRVWAQRSAEWTSDLGAQGLDRFPLANHATRAGITAALGVPILHENHVVAVLLFSARALKREDENTVQIVSQVAKQLGFALRHKLTLEDLRTHEALLRSSRDELEIRVSERTVQLKIANEALRAEIVERERVQREMETRVRQQRAVAAIGAQAMSEASLASLYDAVCEIVTRTLDVEFCKILELQADGKSFLLCAGAGWKSGVVGHTIIDAGPHSQAGYALESNGPVIVEDLSSEVRFEPAPLFRDHGVVSGLSVIIRGHERPFGVLGAHSARRRKFKTEDVHFLEAVGHILSAAIQRANSESAIQKSEAWLRNLIATTQDAVVSIDRRGCVALFNRSAERMFGYKAEEIIGQKVNLLMGQPYAAEHDGYIARYEKTGEARAIGKIRMVTARHKDGTLFPIELSVAEIDVDQDVHYAAFIRDISDKARLERQLIESEKLAAIGGTAARIGHEIANPLNGIYLTLQLVEQRLARQAGIDERITSDVARIKKEIGRLNQLVQEFRTLSRQQPYHFQMIHLGALINEVLELQKPLYEAQGITVRRDIAADLPAASVDEDRMKQALLNLIKNAVEAMPAGGALTVTVRFSADEVFLDISDTGTGISPGSDIFAPLFTTKKEGTGLGLIIVRQIIVTHHGRITYESQPGKGTTFHVVLPFNSAAT